MKGTVAPPSSRSTAAWTCHSFAFSSPAICREIDAMTCPRWGGVSSQRPSQGQTPKLKDGIFVVERSLRVRFGVILLVNPLGRVTRPTIDERRALLPEFLERPQFDHGPPHALNTWILSPVLSGRRGLYI